MAPVLHVPHIRLAHCIFRLSLDWLSVLQMYLHLLDHSRDKALANKGDSVLIDKEGIPANWWDPVPHQGLIFDESERKWIRPLGDLVINNESAAPSQQ